MWILFLVGMAAGGALALALWWRRAARAGRRPVNTIKAPRAPNPALGANTRPIGIPNTLAPRM
jgi:hypothetical protein